MRMKSLLAATAALVCVGLALPDQASAFDHDRSRPDGWGHARAIHHHVYYPRYVHHYHVDPYAYQYSPRGYYPYYNSRYWKPAHVVRERNRAHYNNWNVQPPRYKYYPSWGYPKGHVHGEWCKHEHPYSHRWYR